MYTCPTVLSRCSVVTSTKRPFTACRSNHQATLQSLSYPSSMALHAGCKATLAATAAAGGSGSSMFIAQYLHCLHTLVSEPCLPLKVQCYQWMSWFHYMTAARGFTANACSSAGPLPRGRTAQSTTSILLMAHKRSLACISLTQPVHMCLMTILPPAAGHQCHMLQPHYCHS